MHAQHGALHYSLLSQPKESWLPLLSDGTAAIEGLSYWPWMELHMKEAQDRIWDYELALDCTTPFGPCYQTDINYAIGNTYYFPCHNAQHHRSQDCDTRPAYESVTGFRSMFDDVEHSSIARPRQARYVDWIASTLPASLDPLTTFMQAPGASRNTDHAERRSASDSPGQASYVGSTSSHRLITKKPTVSTPVDKSTPVDLDSHRNALGPPLPVPATALEPAQASRPPTQKRKTRTHWPVPTARTSQAKR